MTGIDPRVTGGDGTAGTPHARAQIEILPANPSPAVTDHEPTRLCQLGGVLPAANDRAVFVCWTDCTLLRGCLRLDNGREGTR